MDSASYRKDSSNRSTMVDPATLDWAVGRSIASLTTQLVRDGCGSSAESTRRAYSATRAATARCARRAVHIGTCARRRRRRLSTKPTVALWIALRSCTKVGIVHTDTTKGLANPRDIPTGLASPMEIPKGLASPRDIPTGLASPMEIPKGLANPRVKDTSV